ncbi:hypothetical protein RAJCM14343_4918 [Rhodococcus aetherivorans]|uniref:Uncharacterized protein n=1 Tax=Rhodococcus aetherivorans TaxID=191292 RepID=A0ABQ0YT70_9NOCA|nr:hypothetical protein RAJCM14343_4918 [Rhodococcus aetherivorans]
MGDHCEGAAATRFREHFLRRHGGGAGVVAGGNGRGSQRRRTSRSGCAARGCARAARASQTTRPCYSAIECRFPPDSVTFAEETPPRRGSGAPWAWSYPA